MRAAALPDDRRRVVRRLERRHAASDRRMVDELMFQRRTRMDQDRKDQHEDKCHMDAAR